MKCAPSEFEADPENWSKLFPMLSTLVFDGDSVRSGLIGRFRHLRTLRCEGSAFYSEDGISHPTLSALYLRNCELSKVKATRHAFPSLRVLHLNRCQRHINNFFVFDNLLNSDTLERVELQGLGEWSTHPISLAVISLDSPDTFRFLAGLSLLVSRSQPTISQDQQSPSERHD